MVMTAPTKACLQRKHCTSHGLAFAARSTRGAPASAMPVRQAEACGEVAEWLKAHAWKVCLRETVTRVRIPLSPPVACASSKSG